jgi:hypothetical protein
VPLETAQKLASGIDFATGIFSLADNPTDPATLGMAAASVLPIGKAEGILKKALEKAVDDGILKKGEALYETVKNGIDDALSSIDFMPKSLPQKAAYTLDDLPTDESVKGLTFYHGSKGGANIEELQSSFTKIDGLIGSGVYTTDKKSLAETYQKKKGSLYRIDVGDVGKVLNMEKPITPEIAQMFKVPGYDTFDEVIDEATKEGGSIIDVYRKLTDEISYQSHSEGIPDYEYDELIRSIEANFREAGYGAFTHIGGVRAGGGKNQHRVLMLLDPAAEYGSYPKLDIKLTKETK